MEDSYEYSDEESEEIGEENENDFMRCYCEGHCPFGDEKGTCILKPGGKCFTSVEATLYDDGFEYPVFTYGCLPANEMALMQCKGSLVPHTLSKSIHCCDHMDYCNKKLLPLYEIKDSTPNPNFISDKIPFIILVSSLGCCFVILGIIISTIWIRYKKRRMKKKKAENEEEEEANISTDNDVLINLANLMMDGSDGSNLANTVQTTIAQEVDLEKSIGSGRYGEVWLARWQEDKVAVKIFHKAHVYSWYSEIKICQSVLMRHENILGFIAADIKGSGNWTQTMLITDYHEHGSLFNYLQTHALDTLSLLRMACSIAKGLAYLHTEVFGIHGKPAIAHRDLHSKSILVKNSRECCISDFGLAVKYIRNSNQIAMPKGERKTTIRYMSPEMLDGSMNMDNFEDYIKADMYSLGLILWEIIRRCEVDDCPILEYAKPFHGLVNEEPTVEEMREIVCAKKIRPDILEDWRNVGVLNTIVKVMQELWHDNPSARLTSLRVKKTLLECKL